MGFFCFFCSLKLLPDLLLLSLSLFVSLFVSLSLPFLPFSCSFICPLCFCTHFSEMAKVFLALCRSRLAISVILLSPVPSFPNPFYFASPSFVFSGIFSALPSTSFPTRPLSHTLHSYANSFSRPHNLRFAALNPFHPPPPPKSIHSARAATKTVKCVID